MLERGLIVNADDYGLTPGVSEGILHAHRVGIVTSTTFLVNLPEAAVHVPPLLALPTLGVGLHVNLTTGEPVAAQELVPRLLGRDGRLSKSWSHLGRVPKIEVEREVQAQLARFCALLGRLPTHLDTHRYTQLLPGVARVLARVASEYHLPVRRIRPGELPGPWWLARRLRRLLAESERIFQEAKLTGARQILMGDFDTPGLLARLAGLRPGVTELVTHPAWVDAALAESSSLIEGRAVERLALTDPMTRAMVRSQGISLLHFGQLGGSACSG